MKLFKGIYLDITLYLITYLYIFTQIKHTYLNIILIVISAFFIAFWLMAKHQLGEAFTINPEPKTLITTGLYSYFRHPIYLFTEIANICLALVINNAYLYILLILHIFIQFLRARKEEKLLQNKFKEAYTEHQKKTYF